MTEKDKSAAENGQDNKEAQTDTQTSAPKQKSVEDAAPLEKPVVEKPADKPENKPPKKWIRTIGSRIKEIDGLLMVLFLMATLLLTWDNSRRTEIRDRVSGTHANLEAVLDATLNLGSINISENVKVQKLTLLMTLRHRVASGSRTIKEAGGCVQKLVAHVDLYSRGNIVAYTRDKQEIDRDALIFDLTRKLRNRIDAWEKKKRRYFIGYFYPDDVFADEDCFKQ